MEVVDKDILGTNCISVKESKGRSNHIYVKALCQAKEWSGPDKAVKDIREHSGSDDFKKW